jgi:hypothetical protein
MPRYAIKSLRATAMLEGQLLLSPSSYGRLRETIGPPTHKCLYVPWFY